MIVVFVFNQSLLLCIKILSHCRPHSEIKYQGHFDILINNIHKTDEYVFSCLTRYKKRHCFHIYFPIFEHSKLSQSFFSKQSKMNYFPTYGANIDLLSMKHSQPVRIFCVYVSHSPTIISEPSLITILQLSGWRRSNFT